MVRASGPRARRALAPEATGERRRGIPDGRRPARPGPGALSQRLVHLRDRLHGVAQTALQNAREQLDAETERLRFVTHNFLRDCHTNLTEKAVTIRHLDPANVLKRGYALLLRNGRILTQTAGVQAGETLQVKMHDGSVTVNVV